MNELSERTTQFPNTLPELSKFILVGREKLTAVRAEIRAIKKVGLAKEVLEQKKTEAQEIAELVTMSEMQVGRMLKEIPKATPNNNPFHENTANMNFVKGKTETVSELGFNRNQVSEYQRMADNEPAVKRAIEKARQNNDIVSRSAVMQEIKAESKPKPHITNNSGDNEWFTPSEYIEAARTAMGSIDLDPASNDFANRTVRATTYYTEETDGLTKEWFGNIWMNPPYSTGLIKAFVDKLVGSSFEQAIVLVNNATETEWFRKMVDKATAFIFPSGRIRFEKKDGAKNSPLQGQAFIYFGNNPDRFLEIFKKYGWGGKL